MKAMKFTSLILACFFSLHIIAGDPDLKKNDDKYCAKVKDGKVAVMHDGNPITGTVTLTNGTQVMTDGTIVMRDGTKTTLKEDECVDKDGKITKENQTKDKDHEK